MSFLQEIGAYIAALFLAFSGATATPEEPSPQLGGGTGTINQLDQWSASTTPYNAITPRVAGKDIYAPNSTATTSKLYATTFCINNSSPDCITSWPAGGSGGGSISTSTIPTAGHVAYWTTNSTLSGTATTTLTGTAPIAFSQPINVLGSAASIVTCADASGSAKGCLTAADYLIFGNKLGTTSIDTLAELESIAGVTNILIENDIDASSELAAIMDDETGTGALVFGTSPTFSFPNMSGATLNGTTTLVNATTTTFAITGLTSELLMVDGNGSVLEALAGTNYEVPVTAGDGLTRTVNDFDCDTASASAFGCLASVDYLLFGNKLGSTSIDSLAEIEAIAGVTNILIENDIDASSELAAIMDDETGTGALVFGTGSSLSSTTLTNATATVIFATTATSTNLFSTHATTSSFAANIICLLGDCRTAWPTSGAGGGSNWTYVVGTPSYISPSTTVGTLISASSTIGAGTQQGGLTIYGGATTTGNSTIQGTLTLSTALTVANGGTGSTTLSGILKGAGTGAIETAVADSDYQVPLTFGDGLTRTANDIDCDTATAAAFGCLAAVDYLAFGNKLGTTSIDSLAEIESIAGVTNILIENDIDASSELLAIMDDETGTGALVFGTSPTLSFPNMTGATLLGTSTFVHSTGTSLHVGTLCLTADSCRTTWPAGGGGSDGNWVFAANALGIYPATTTNDVWLGTTATATAPFWWDVSATTSYIGLPTDNNGMLQLGAAGVHIMDDGDGAITFTGLGNGSDEALTFNLDDTSDTVTITSTTSLATANFSSIALQESGNAVINVTEIDTYSELDTIVADAVLTHNGLIDTYSELDTLVADAVLTHNGLIDTSSEIAGIVGDETGTGALVFGTSPTFSFPIMSGATLNGTTTLVNATSTTFFTQFASSTQATSTTFFAHIASSTNLTALNLLSTNITANTSLAALDWGGGASLEIPNGTAPTVDAIGELAFDTSDGQLLIGTSTNASYPRVVTMPKLWGATIASTSADFVSGGRIWLPPQRDGFTVREIHCAVDAGTSVVLNLSNSGGTTDSETITCDADGATDTSIASNATYAAGSLNSIEIGTVTGTVDYLTFSIWGDFTRE